MSFFFPLRPLLKGWLISVLGWGLVAALLGTAQVLDGQVRAGQAVGMAVRDWLPWALITPLLFRLVSRLPLERSRWAIALPAHLCCALLTLLGLYEWKAVWSMSGKSAATVWSGRPGPPPVPPGEEDGPPGRDDRHRPFGRREDLGWPGPPPAEGPFDPNHRPPGPGRPSAGEFFHFLSTDLPIYLMIVCGAHAMLFFRREEERAAGLARARLDTLHLQLQPHFLFNSLNTIAGLVHEDPDRAEAMLLALSDLLRLTLASQHEAELTLGRELQFVESYLSIMHTRFEEKLQFEFEIAPETRSALIPSFFLQPLVESAVQQELGLNRGAGLVKIRAWRELQELHVSVADHSQPPGESAGLIRARARLRELYGTCATLIQRTAEGCIVHITLPFHTTAL